MTRSRTRLVAPLLAVAVAAGLVASCGGSTEEKADNKNPGSTNTTGIECPVDALADITTPVELRIWHTQVGKPLDAMTAIAKRYNESQNKVVVNFENQGTYDEQSQKFEAAIADPKSLPDIIMPDDTVTRFMADSGAVIPADACIDADPESKKLYDDMVPIIRAAFSIDGVLWPGAFNAADAGLFYNLSHFEAAGLDVKNPPKTLDEVRTVAEKLKAAKIPGLEEPMVMKVNPWILEFLISGAGQHMVNEDNGRTGLATKSLYDNETSLKVFTWLKEMQDDGLLKMVDYTQDIDQFLAMAFQTSSMLIDSTSAISTVDAAISGTLKASDVGLDDSVDLSGFNVADLKIGVGQLPGLKEPGRGQVGGSMWYLVDTGDDQSIAAAWDFMKYFNTPEVQASFAIDGSSFPVSKTAAKDINLQNEWTSTRSGQWLATVYKSFKDLDPANPGPVIGPYKEFRQTVRKGIEAMMFNKGTPEAAVKQIDKDFQKELDSYAADVKG